MTHSSNILVIGVNGNVCVNWGEWGGGGFGGSVCPNCGGAPPQFSGPHSDRCTCCQGAVDPCAGGSGNVCTLEWHDHYEDPEDCRGGWVRYSGGGGHNSGFAGVQVHGQGNASVKALVGPFPTFENGQFYPMRLTGSYSMRWSCGDKGDVIKGRCRSWGGPHEDGVCLGGSEASVNLESLHITDHSDAYDCPCQCLQPLGGYCEFGPGIIQASCDSGIGTSWCCNDPDWCFTMGWESCHIKGPLPHSVGRDPVEIADNDCCNEGSNYCCTRDIDQVTGHYPVSFGGADPTTLTDWGCPSEWSLSNSFAGVCPEYCEDNCGPAGVHCGPGTIMGDYGNGCNYCPQLLNVTPGTTCWDCLKPQVCSWGYAEVLQTDPQVTTPLTCYVALSVSASSQGGDCAELGNHGNFDGCPDCECDPSCPTSDDIPYNTPTVCSHVHASVGINTI